MQAFQAFCVSEGWSCMSEVCLSCVNVLQGEPAMAIPHSLSQDEEQ